MKHGTLTVEPTPERPGPGEMPEALLRALELTIGRRVDGLLAGDHRSALLGRGSELAQIRPYVPGDDVRLIDWNVTARTRVPHVRAHLAERVLVTWVVLDRTPSMAFGTADRRKDDVALGVALALGHAASVRGNRVGLVAFGQGPTAPLPPRQGRTGLVGVWSALHEDGDGVAPGLAGALAGVGAAARQRALIVLVSDFRGPLDWQARLLDLAGRHDILAVEIRTRGKACWRTWGRCGSPTRRPASVSASTRATFACGSASRRLPQGSGGRWRPRSRASAPRTSSSPRTETG